MSTALTTTMAVKAFPKILAEVAPSLAPMAKDACDVIKTVGCRDQIAMVKSLNAISPDFMAYSNKLADKLITFAQVAEQSDSKRYDLIVEAVLNDEKTTLTQKVGLVKELEQRKGSERRALIKTIGQVAAVPLAAVTTIAIAPKISGDISSVSKSKIVADAVKSFSPKGVLEAWAKLRR